MPESAALVPVPFYAPVRVGTGSSFKDGKTYRRPLLLEQRVRVIASEPDDGLAYHRDGRFITESRIGIRVNLYV